MGLGRQHAPVEALVTFCLWAQRNGLRVGEMHGFTSVNPRVHAKTSWHYDRDGKWGKGADINHPAGGATERAALAHAAAVARELGLGFIFGQHGANGPARTHQGHLHVDVGPYANLGAGPLTVPQGGDLVTSALQRAVNAHPDQAWGANTHWRLETVALASRFHGGQFPWGIAHCQRVLGVADDGDWGPKSEAAHDRAIAAIQRALGVGDDGTWGNQTQGAYDRARDIRWRR